MHTEFYNYIGSLRSTIIFLRTRDSSGAPLQGSPADPAALTLATDLEAVELGAVNAMLDYERAENAFQKKWGDLKTPALSGIRNYHTLAGAAGHMYDGQAERAQLIFLYDKAVENPGAGVGSYPRSFLREVEARLNETRQAVSNLPSIPAGLAAAESGVALVLQDLRTSFAQYMRLWIACYNQYVGAASTLAGCLQRLKRMASVWSTLDEQAEKLLKAFSELSRWGGGLGGGTVAASWSDSTLSSLMGSSASSGS